MRMPTSLPPSLRRWRVTALLLLLSLTATAWSQTTDTTAVDPPTRVARLSYLAGDVGVLPAGAHDWSDADVNRPLTDGDQLSSGADARAELELGGAMLHVDGDTDLGLLALNGQLGQFELTQGTLELSVRSLANGQSYEIDTPTVALVMDQPGSFRVDIGADGRSTTVTAFNGNAVVFGQNNAQQDVIAGRSYQFDDASLSDVGITDVGGNDAFDAWCSDRDRRYTDAMTPRYVSTEVVGAEDLDNYGDWNDDPEYGEVWYPAHVVAGWAPYRFGHWVWITPWGWTWVDDAPWGFAPFHYGRWAYIRGAWGWLPGPRYARPIYAPALVAFVGGGRHWGVSVGLGAPVGWFPLGPGEIFNPWYHASRGYYSRVNIADLRDRHGHSPHDIAGRIERHYGDFQRGRTSPGMDYAHHHPHGFTAVPERSFAEAHDVHRHLLHVDPRRLAHAPIEARGVRVKPVPVNPLSSRNPRLRSLPTAGFRRPVVMRHAPDDERFVRAGRYNVAHPDYRVSAGIARPDVPPTTPRSNVRAYGGNHPATLPTPPRLITAHDLQRTGELPSARFAQQHRDTRREYVQRPGVSFVGRGSEPSRETQHPVGALPPEPRFERVQSLPRDTGARESAARFEAARRMRDERAPPATYRTHVDAMPRSYNNAAPRSYNNIPQRSYNSAPHPDYRAPAFRQPPRVEPERRAPQAHSAPSRGYGGHAPAYHPGDDRQH
ncbi:DUF6600 domain-containing protein [Rhodanobacter glycinis]|uniref:FecR protein domain-containing protein n=1 Tax=Rhodanobacter glycinis TaxID=582702 RepID=A0A1I4A316_9GAMM|nr:DUF6600 domain-containing protein [Rhodanobacter glycinis]SFK50149.1 hypothetical protein SAMN05192579_103220 [Rhodanobacter glycinis]